MGAPLYILIVLRIFTSEQCFQNTYFPQGNMVSCFVLTKKISFLVYLKPKLSWMERNVLIKNYFMRL